MEALYCPICMGEFLLGEVFYGGNVPTDIPAEELMRQQGSTIVLDAREGLTEKRDAFLHLPKVGEAAISRFSNAAQVALICRECYAVEPIKKENVQLI